MKLIIENVFTTVINCPEEIKKALKEIMSYDIPNAKYIIRYKLDELDKKLDQAKSIAEMRRIKDKMEYWTNWNGKRYLFDEKNNRFPSGLLYILEGLYYDEIEEKILSFNIPKEEEYLPYREPIHLEKYQQEAYKEIMSMDYRCILYAATGAGKTVMAIKAIRDLSVKTVVIVPNLTLLKQWIEGITRFLDVDIPKEKKKGYRIIHDHNNKERILITTVPFLYNVFYDKRESTAERNKTYRDFVRDAGMVIYDECHRAASPKKC